MFRCSISFFIITMDTGAHKVFPCVLPAPRKRKDVIDGERDIRPPAVLAPVAVAPQNVLAREDDLLVRDPYIEREPHDAGKRHRGRHRPDPFAVVRFDELHLPQTEKDDGLLRVDHAHRLIILIQDQNLCIQPAQCGGRFGPCAEDTSRLVNVNVSKNIA